MYNHKLDPDKDLAEKYLTTLNQPMDPMQRKLLSEIFELNRQARIIKKEINECIDIEKMKQLLNQKKELQLRILDLYDEIDKFDKMN